MAVESNPTDSPRGICRQDSYWRRARGLLELSLSLSLARARSYLVVFLGSSAVVFFRDVAKEAASARGGALVGIRLRRQRQLPRGEAAEGSCAQRDIHGGAENGCLEKAAFSARALGSESCERRS